MGKRKQKTGGESKTNRRKSTLKKKILTGFIAVLILLLMAGGGGIFALLQTQKDFQGLQDNQVNNLLLVKDLRDEMQNQNVAINQYLVTGDSAVKDKYYTSQKQYLLILNKLEKKMKSADSRQLLQKIESVDQEFINVVNQEFQLKEAKNEKELANVMNTSLKQITSDFKDATQKLVDYEKKQMDMDSKATRDGVHLTILIIEILSIAALVLGIAIAIYMGRKISTPIKKASSFMKIVAKGNLNVEKLSVKSKDELGELAVSFNQMVDDLRQVVRQVADSSMQVAASSEQLTASAQQSTSASEQVSHIVMGSAEGMDKQLQTFSAITSSVNEMAESIKNISEYSKGMLDDSQQTLTLTEKGSESVSQVVSQMNEIHSSVINASGKIDLLGKRSNEIMNITSLITGIAEQTNLLALNAAIESARAGEHGKGFAVVADEVRKLAEESRKSADQISHMITLIQREVNETVAAMELGKERVQQGLSFTKDVDTAFQDISSSMKNVTKKVKDVSGAVNLIQSTTSHIVLEMDQAKEISEQLTVGSQQSASATQEQLASMEEISASAEALSNLAEDLQMTVGKFQLL